MIKREKVVYFLVKGVIKSISFLPFKVLYFLSDLLFPIAYYVVRYRRKVVRKNLISSFPKKNIEEIKALERNFYRYFCDVIVETIKLFSVSRDKILKHIEFRNLDLICDRFAQGQHCAGILGHYGNWEWLSVTQLAMTANNNFLIGLIFRPLRNKIFNRMLIEIRQSHLGVCLPSKTILRRFVKYRNEGKMTLFGFIADQAPSMESTHLWVNFLNKYTPVFTGTEHIIRKNNNAVFYVDMQRKVRGYYVCTFIPMTYTPNDLPFGELTRRYFSLLEESINRDPQLYLWSHNRWKCTYEQWKAWKRKRENKHFDCK